MLVHDATVYFLDKLLWVGHALAQLVHDILVALGVGVRHIVAQADVAPLHHTVHLLQLKS